MTNKDCGLIRALRHQTPAHRLIRENKLLTSQHYGTQQVIRACVRPGMLVRHDGQTWTAGANTRGKLILYTLRTNKVIKDCFVHILLDARGNALGDYVMDESWTGTYSN